MSFARWWFDRFREFRSFRWYYNPRWLNIEYGEKAEPAIREQLKAFDPNNQNADSTLVHVPPQLEEIRQAYENKAIDSIEQFRKRTNQLFSKLDVCSEKGITNVHLMRRDLFGYLKTFAFMSKYKLIVWLIFFASLIGLALLDFAPTLFVFESLMEGDSVSIGAAFGIDDDQARNDILLLSTFSFLMVIVLIGHVVAKLVASSYLDGELPLFGIAISLVIMFVFVDVAKIRYAHEVRTAEDSYQSYIKSHEKAVALGTATTSAPTAIDEWMPGYLTRAFFNSALFVLISVMIFIVAIYLSLWRVYGDIRMITRHFKQNRYRVNCAKITSQMRNEANTLNNSWEKLRQSAQIEVEQFMIGVRQGIHNNLKDYEGKQNYLASIEALISQITLEFSKRLELPKNYANSENTILPSHEEEWGLRYNTFLTEAVLYESFSKGAMDAVNTGYKNPESAVDSIVDYRPNKGEKHSHWLPALNTAECNRQYEAGFNEGSHVPNGMGWKKQQLAAKQAKNALNNEASSTKQDDSKPPVYSLGGES